MEIACTSKIVTSPNLLIIHIHVLHHSNPSYSVDHNSGYFTCCNKTSTQKPPRIYAYRKWVLLGAVRAKFLWLSRRGILNALHHSTLFSFHSGVILRVRKMKWIFDFRQMCDLWHTTEHEYAFLETFFTLQPRKHRTQWNISFSWRSFVFFLLAPADFSIFMNESLINLSTDTVDCHYSRYWNENNIFTISIQLEFSSD